MRCFYNLLHWIDDAWGFPVEPSQMQKIWYSYYLSRLRGHHFSFIMLFLVVPGFITDSSTPLILLRLEIDSREPGPRKLFSFQSSLPNLRLCRILRVSPVAEDLHLINGISNRVYPCKGEVKALSKAKTFRKGLVSCIVLLFYQALSCQIKNPVPSGIFDRLLEERLVRRVRGKADTQAYRTIDLLTEPHVIIISLSQNLLLTNFFFRISSLPLIIRLLMCLI